MRPFVLLLMLAASTRADELDWRSLYRPPAKLTAYDRAYAKALADKRPLVVFSGVSERAIPGAVTVTHSFGDGELTGIVVGVPRADGTFSRYDLPATADDATIREYWEPYTGPPAKVRESGPINLGPEVRFIVPRRSFGIGAAVCVGGT